MKKMLGILIGITAVAVVGMIIYRRQNEDTGTMLKQVSDEGYETAHDVLFPKKSKKGRGLRYGPILPNN
jgi:hypothetical protein